MPVFKTILTSPTTSRQVAMSEICDRGHVCGISELQFLEKVVNHAFGYVAWRLVAPECLLPFGGKYLCCGNMAELKLYDVVELTKDWAVVVPCP